MNFGIVLREYDSNGHKVREVQYPGFGTPGIAVEIYSPQAQKWYHKEWLRR